MRLFMSMRLAIAVDNGQGCCFSGDRKALAMFWRVAMVSECAVIALFVQNFMRGVGRKTPFSGAGIAMQLSVTQLTGCALYS